MARSPPASGDEPAAGLSASSRSRLLPRLWRDPVLRSAFLVAGGLSAYQLSVTVFHPPWNRPVTDWLRALLAWPELLGVVLVSLWFTRTQQRMALSWWLLSAALLSYTLARDLWMVEDQFLFPSHVPFPSWPDLFFALQYPFFFLALILLPRARPWAHRARVVLDACLLMGTVLALSWYFLLAPVYLYSRAPLLGKLITLSFPAGNLAVLFGLIVILLRHDRYAVERATLALLIGAIACLVIADSWAAWMLLNQGSYQTGSPPDLFWLACYLLVPLAGLVQLRLTQRRLSGEPERPAKQPNYQWQDVLTSCRFILPVAAALLASALILVRALLPPIQAMPPLNPLLLVLVLLVLVLLRQGLTLLENERLRRERDQALREATGQVEAFLGIAGHELKNPLASMKLCLQLAERRIQQTIRREPDAAPNLEPVREPVAQAERQGERLDRLVNDLLDVSRVRAGKLELHLAPTDLAAIVREAVEEQRQVSPERLLRLVCPEELQVPVTADAQRIGQVVTNYLTNALKYSPADRPVKVGLAVEGHQARVWVRDEGPGLPVADQERIWDRFHQAKGIEVQSGSGVGLGLGLHICRTIIAHHQGQVGVQSTRGAGSTFWFSLPLAMSEPAQEERAAGALGC